MYNCKNPFVSKITTDFCLGAINEQHKEKDDTVIRHFSKTLKFFPYFSTLNIKPWMVEEVRNVLHINCFDDILNEYQKVKGEFLYE